MVIRTRHEEPCSNCGKTTNAYDAMMGRLCPLCIAQYAANLGRGLEFQAFGKINLDFGDADMSYLCNSNKHLLTDPLIDHSNDIDKNKKA